MATLYDASAIGALHNTSRRQAYSLVETAKLNGVDHEAWLCDTIARIAAHSARRIDELFSWRDPCAVR